MSTVWQKTFDALQDVITILSPDLKVLHANRAAYTTFGLDDGDLVDRYCYEIFHNRSHPCNHCPVHRPDKLQSHQTGLIYHDRLDKTFEITSSPVFDDDGELLYLVHSARDITQKLKDDAERNILSTAVRQTSESVVITDISGAIQYVNPSYSKTTGYSQEELIGKHISFCNINPDSAALFEELLKRLKKGDVWQGQLVNEKKDGSHFTENVTIFPIVTDNNDITNFVAIKRDVTKEEQLQRQLQQAMKMEAIGTLAGGIAHDFNNILSAMIGYGQIAKSRLEQGNPLHEDLEQILLAGDRAANLVKQILTFSRRDTQENFHPLKLQYITKETLNLLSCSLPTTIELRQSIDNSCPPILADPGQLHQVVMNLCTNAKQAIGGNYGSLSLTLKEAVITEPQILPGSALLTSGRYVHLIVEDTGIGMDQETLGKIFDPFFTTKPKDQGTGLGLSVVHGIVEKHGGIITAQSKAGEGTSFHLYFPAVKETPHVTPEPAVVESLGSERVMVVDDEAIIAKVTAHMLQRHGYKVTVYTNSLEAVSDYRINPQDYDLIITDMTMPNMTGAELSREILSFRPELPIIMTTGYSEIIDEDKAARLGIRAFMLKPIKKEALLHKVRKVLDDVTNSSN